MKEIKRGDLYYADLRPIIGSEQGGVRPVLIIQNDVGNHFSPTVIAAAITSRRKNRWMPTHVPLRGYRCGLRKYSVVLLEQIRTIDRTRLKDYIPGCYHRYNSNPHRYRDQPAPTRTILRLLYQQ